MIGSYRAYALIGESKLSDKTDYISFAGDFGFSGQVPPKEVIARHLADESKLLSNFGLSLINLEAMLPGVSGEESDMQIDEFSIDTLKEAGYDVVAYANNHALDYGPEGLNHNATHLLKSGLAVIGTREFPVYEWETNGKKVAIFALTHYLDKKDQKRHVLTTRETDLAFIAKQTSQADFRIAFVHLGSMSRFLSPHERRQVERLLAAGTDLVVCTGSHFIKGFITENGKPVAYGIGNHLFFSVDSSTEPVGMHVVAGFELGQLVQVFVVPFYNAIQERKVGPLDEISFASFKKVLIERSNIDADKYYSDPHSLDRLKEQFTAFRLSDLRRIHARHFVYAVRIVFYNYPIAATAACLLALSVPVLIIRSTNLTRKGRKAVRKRSSLSTL